MGGVITKKMVEVSENVGFIIQDSFGPKDTSGHCLARMVMAAGGNNLTMKISRKLVGSIVMPGTRVSAIEANAFEKILRTAGYWVKNPSTTLSSAQSADPAHGRYAGGVIFPSKNGLVSALAISGYSALEDEAGVLEVALRTGLCDESYVRRVIEASDNQVFPILHRNYKARFGLS